MIEIKNTGGIVFDDYIVCDGYHENAKLRVQSHIHTDHLADLGSSKQKHNILMSFATREFLALGKNSMDILRRPGIIGIAYKQVFKLNGFKIF